MCYSRVIKTQSIAKRKNRIQIVDTYRSIETRISNCFAALLP